MVSQARNPAQMNRLLGGSPPGAPPANAFDMDPAELDRMLSEGWTMFEDGTLAPPATAGGMDLGAQTGYDQPNVGPALNMGPGAGVAGNVATPPVGPALGGPIPAGAVPPGAAGVGAGVSSIAPAGPAITPPGLPPIGPTPPPPDIGGVASALPGTPGVSTGVGIDRGPSAGLGLERDHPADYFSDTEPAGAEPALDPFAYVAEQNRVSAIPSYDANKQDPGGYSGPDVSRSDPTALLPRRRRTPPVAGPQSRLDVRKGMGSQRITHPVRRP